MTLNAAALTAWEDWTHVAGDAALFAPLLAAIYKKHGLPFTGITATMPATNAVFRIGATAAKIYMPHADGSMQDKEAERIALHEAAVRGVPAPKILAHGVENGFPYLITGFIEGQTFAAAEPHMTAAEKEALGRQLRVFTDRLNQPSAPFNSIDVLHDADRQERWEIYPTQFQAERRAWIAGHNFGRRILVHGDLNRENLLLSATGPVLIDFGEACLAPVSYEQAEIAAELFRFDPHLMRGYFGDTPPDTIESLCFEGLLIHDFGGDILRRFCPAEEFTSLGALHSFLREKVKR